MVTTVSIRKMSPRLPIIGLTGDVRQGLMMQVSGPGVVCLSKSSKVSDLYNKINHMLQSWRSVTLAVITQFINSLIRIPYDQNNH